MPAPALRPFWSYYGGKWRSAPRYPAPLHGRIVEPFAGAAGYATRWSDRRVLLVDADPVIAGLWSWLIRVSEADLLSIPAVVGHVDDVHLCQEARWLVGFWLNAGASHPCRTPSKWMRSGQFPGCHWCAKVRDRLASQLGGIRHWRVACASSASARSSRRSRPRSGRSCGRRRIFAPRHRGHRSC